MSETTFAPGTHARRMLDEIRANPQGTREDILCQYIDKIEGDPISPEAEQVNYSDEPVKLNPNLKVKELQEICKEQGIAIRGSKAELIERIEAHMNGGEA